MQKKQRTFFIVMGAFQILVILVMGGWILLDAYKAILAVSQQPTRQFLLEPIVWHKMGEIFLVFPVGIAFAGFYIFWRSDLRLRFLRIATPIMITGGVFNLFASWGYTQKPQTEFASFMVYFAFILFLASLLLPFVLKWVHHKRAQVEAKTNSHLL